MIRLHEKTRPVLFDSEIADRRGTMHQEPDSTVIHWPVFFIAALALLLTPGTAVVYVVSRSMEHSYGSGLISALGVGAGSLIHVVVATFGLSAVFITWPVSFVIVKYAGAAYFLYLGVRQFMTARNDDAARRGVITGAGSTFRQGILVNLLNPNRALFLYVFVPQFVHTEAGAVASQVLELGLVFTLMGLVTDSSWAGIAGVLGSSLRHHPKFFRVQRYVSGTIFIVLGAITALSAALHSHR